VGLEGLQAERQIARSLLLRRENAEGLETHSIRYLISNTKIGPAGCRSVLFLVRGATCHEGGD